MTKKPITDCRLYGFIDAAFLGDRNAAELTQALIAGGVDIIQVRAKKYSDSRRLKLSRVVVQSAATSDVPIIINDDIDAALNSGADGVHLGQEDWAAIPPADRAGRLVKLHIVGISTHSLEQARDAVGDGADYIGVGPIFATGTKPDAAPVGLDFIRQAAARIRVPFFAIGGINLTNLPAVLAAGATRVAVVSAILNAPDVAKAAAAFKAKLP
jgi:thiamine-phosphate pyrophosphorylase